MSICLPTGPGTKLDAELVIDGRMARLATELRAYVEPSLAAA